MAPGFGVKAPVPRTRSGCLTCRKRKVKCDESKPVCSRCHRLQRQCTWSDELLVIPHRQQASSSSSPESYQTSLQFDRLACQNFVMELPNVDRSVLPYIHHFVTFCTRFLCYANDNESNPFQDQLFPQASSSPALLNAMAALAAGHLSRSQRHHRIAAANHYAAALRHLNESLSDDTIARSDSTLGACLLLCVYEISHPDSSLWLDHLHGARDLITYRGGPKTTEYLCRFFSVLDISGSLLTGGGPLLPGYYWIEPGPTQTNRPLKTNRWPYYDSDDIMVSHFHTLMTFMARMAHLSAESLSDFGLSNPDVILQTGIQIHDELMLWWRSCPPQLRDQGTDWRRANRPQKLTVPETLENEAFSSIKSCLQGCIIYLNHILDPLSDQTSNPEVSNAIYEITEIARETPKGYGLEMGLYFGLFMAGVAIFNDAVAENLIRQKLHAGQDMNIYHPDRAIELLEELWRRQHEYGTKHDWRQLQKQIDIHIFILV